MDAAAVKDIFREKVRTRKIVQYCPYPWQLEFHNAGAENRQRAIFAGNRCISPWTYIETGSSTVIAGDILFGGEFPVRAWGGESECDAQFSGAFLKGIERAYRVVLDNGSFLIVPVSTGY